MTEYAIYRILLFVFMGLAAGAFAALLFVPVPYGRHNRPGWGPQVRVDVGWFLMESPSLFVFVLVFFISPRNTSPASLVFFGLWSAHYIQRGLVYPWLIRGRQKHLPVVIVLMAFFFTSCNGYLNARWLFNFSPNRGTGWFADPRFIIGALLFIAGFAGNIQSDAILRNLRRPGETGYKIPVGGLFKYVSCANYFSEIVEWSGWALATWSLPGLSFAIWTIANLAPRARSHHLWYREHFRDYPPKRKALVPFLI